MRWNILLQVLVVAFLIPWLLCRALEDLELGRAKENTPTPERQPVQEEKITQPEEEITVTVLTEGTSAQQMPLETYLLGVVLAEMPASFPAEALKAQAVVARTYTMKRQEENPKHSDGAVCTDPGCCQAYCVPDAYLAAGHTREDLQKVTRAVEETKGEVLRYEDTLIDATYFSCSGGRTEAAVAVWGQDVPYLQSVNSPGEENARVYLQEETFQKDTLCDLLGISLEGAPDTWFTDVTYTEGGGVERVSIGGAVYSGTQLRSLLGLRSTAFTVTPADDAVTLTTRGYGHRVGMSQYGAQAMAETGSTYGQILLHYYPGTVLENLTE